MTNMEKERSSNVFYNVLIRLFDTYAEMLDVIARIVRNNSTEDEINNFIEMLKK